jgi:hypothetical protein
MTESIFNTPELNTTKKTLPATLNVLTILTFVGSGIGLLGLVYSFFTAKANVEKIEEFLTSDKFDEMPGFVKKIMSPEMLELARKQVENKIPILLIGTVSMALCIFGALKMRKLKSNGYFIYIIGQVLPLAGTVLFVGMGAYAGFGLFSVLLPLLFIILYTLQKKHLTQ